MNIETGFENMTNDTLVKVAENQYGGISIIAELLDRFTTLVDNWEVLNSQAMIAVAEKQRAEKEKAVALAGLDGLFRQNSVMTTCMHNILGYFRESKNEILMSCGAEVVMHVTDILKNAARELDNIKEGEK